LTTDSPTSTGGLIQANGGDGSDGIDNGGTATPGTFFFDEGGSGGGGGVVHLLATTISNSATIEVNGGKAGKDGTVAPTGGGPGGSSGGLGGVGASPTAPAQGSTAGFVFVTQGGDPEGLLS
jgi:hypothetical protein